MLRQVVLIVTNELNIVNTTELLVLAVALLLQKFLAFHRTGIICFVDRAFPYNCFSNAAN